jgi:2-phosphosulfolactate phosphatase
VLTAHRQLDYALRFDWAATGARATVEEADVAVVVDVLSFTTTVSVALDAGVVVLPYRWQDDEAGTFASRHDAALAVGRSVAGPGEISLSPHSLRRGALPARLVLPSPNGSAIAHELSAGASACVAACLRNGSAVATWIAAEHRPGAIVEVVAAGERWPDGSLRPAIEDLWGAGAVIAGLIEAGWTDVSPEAELARLGYVAVRGRESAALLECANGRELSALGFEADVEIAGEVDHSTVVPALVDGRFVRANRHELSS